MLPLVLWLSGSRQHRGPEWHVPLLESWEFIFSITCIVSVNHVDIVFLLGPWYCLTSTTQADTHTHTHTHTHIQTHTHSLSLSISLSLSLSHTHTLSLPLPLCHTHTHTLQCCPHPRNWYWMAFHGFRSDFYDILRIKRTQSWAPDRSNKSLREKKLVVQKFK